MSQTIIGLKIKAYDKNNREVKDFEVFKANGAFYGVVNRGVISLDQHEEILELRVNE